MPGRKGLIKAPCVSPGILITESYLSYATPYPLGMLRRIALIRGRALALCRGLCSTRPNGLHGPGIPLIHVEIYRPSLRPLGHRVRPRNDALARCHDGHRGGSRGDILHDDSIRTEYLIQRTPSGRRLDTLPITVITAIMTCRDPNSGSSIQGGRGPARS